MKWIWVDRGNDPAYSVLEKHKIDGCFFDVRDPRLSATYLNAVKAKGYAVGVYVADSWLEVKNGTGAECAQWMHVRVAHITGGPVTSVAFPKVQFDLERHDPEWIIDCLLRWRELRPKQDTSWTLEARQAGWMGPAFVAAVTALKIRVAPQLYNGAMTEVWDSLTEARSLVKAGFPDALISPFYDAANYPVYAEGFFFTQGRLKP